MTLMQRRSMWGKTQLHTLSARIEARRIRR
jgi:hypothetical protein